VFARQLLLYSAYTPSIVELCTARNAAKNQTGCGGQDVQTLIKKH
jgi:hypothetical protein